MFKFVKRALGLENTMSIEEYMRVEFKKDYESRRKMGMRLDIPTEEMYRCIEQR